MGAGGVACAAVAKSNGRNPLGWFVVGALTFGLGLIALLILPDIKKQDAMQQRLDDEASRVQDALDKARAIAYARHPDSLKETGGVVDGEAVVSELHTPYQNSNWFHGGEGVCIGPMPFETLHLTWLAESIDGQTLVWRKGMEVWVAIDDLEGMDTALDG